MVTPACTGVTARWCPVHGDCACPPDGDDMDTPTCPLHAPESDHAEEPAGTTLPALADATTELAVTLDRAARAGAEEADPIATAALIEAAQLVARAADLLERTRDRLDPAGAAARRAAMAALLERERPDMFAPGDP